LNCKTYAYEATSRYDPSTKSSRPVRKYLGRVDPETGDIIPTVGKRGRPRKNKDESKAADSKGAVDTNTEMALKLSAAEAEIERLKAENAALAYEKDRMQMFLSKLVKDSSALLADLGT
jgi:hypothetical protein